MKWLRRWLIGDLAERVETIENWCRHHDMPVPPAFRAMLLSAFERADRDQTLGN